ncbi:MAG: ATP-dependent Clp protease ATP-binding subunit [Bryobacterales bacterium]|nr:ATP-dependent Clp protease ATP-binding subunit [Bryobacterales bacterium]
MTAGEKKLDPTRKCPEVVQLEREMNARIVGQAEAVSQIVNHYQTHLAGLTTGGRPICNLLMLGPTGCGKTRVVEALAEALAGDRQALVKIDCGEFQHSHEIAKLIGSPPGYLGHRETHPRLCQERLDLYHSDQMKISFVLFDEIEKASDALWNLLLGILDKGTLTLGDNRQVDFSHSMVFMTGNLGTAEAQRLRDLPWGFSAPRESTATEVYRFAASNKGTAAPLPAMPVPAAVSALSIESQALDGDSKTSTASPEKCTGEVIANHSAGTRKPNPSQTNGGDCMLRHRMEKAVLNAAKRKFAPEFLNRLDRVILCHPLNREEIGDVLDLELTEIVTRIQRHRQCCLLFSLSDEARDFLIDEGFDEDCGARYLKRAIDKYILQPLSSLLATNQISDGDEIVVDLADEETHLAFRRGTRVSTQLALKQLSARWSARPAVAVGRP